MLRNRAVVLKKGERRQLENLIKRGESPARKLTRARILLLSEEGKSSHEIAEALGISQRTSRNVCRRYETEGLEEALNEKPRSGAPTILNGKARAKITALACSQPPEGHGQWSLRLLADKAIELEFVETISHTYIGKILKKTR